MEMQGSRTLAVTQSQAWQALNNLEVLESCIPGCDEVRAVDGNQYSVRVGVKIGPLAAKFNGKITLCDLVPPESYTISFDGQGGSVGFGKGTSKVSLTPQGTGCVLGYTVQASVGGKIAQMGQRLIDSVAKSMAEDFFQRFDAEMRARYPDAYSAMADAAAQLDGSASVDPSPPPRRVPAWGWISGTIVLAALAFWFLALERLG